MLRLGQVARGSRRVPQVFQWRVRQPGKQSLILTLQSVATSNYNEYKDGAQGNRREKTRIDH